MSETSNAELIARKEAAVPDAVTSRTGVYVARAENAELWDVEGKRYIDFTSGIGVLNVGHRHPRVVEAVKKQADQFLHTCFHVGQYESYVALAERLNALAPGATPKKTALFNSGAEAVENAVKVARRATGRRGLVAFKGGYHGRTILTAGLTGKTAPYKLGFGPFPADIYHVPYPNEREGVTSDASLAALRDLFKTQIPAGDVAAIVLEPVQGEGGFIIAPPEFLQELRALCDEHGIMLIADEVQTGFARTGKWFAFEHAGVEPDLIAAAKAMGGGLPISAVIGKAEIMDKVHVSGVGTTYGGNPLSCAAAHAVLDVIEDERLLERAEEVGGRVEDRLKDMQKLSNDGPLAETRRLGAMVAAEFEDRETTGPAPAFVQSLIAGARERGLLLLSAGSRGQVVRVHAPLTIPFDVLDDGLNSLEETYRAALS